MPPRLIGSVILLLGATTALPAEPPTPREILLPVVAVRLAAPTNVIVRLRVGRDNIVTSARIQTHAGDLASLPSLIALKLNLPAGAKSDWEYTAAEIAATRQRLQQPPAPPLPFGPPTALHGQFRAALLRQLSQVRDPTADLELELWVNATGYVAFAALRKAGRAPARGPLTPELRATALRLVPQLGAEKYADRQAAQQALTELGAAIVPLLREQLASTRDPEIRHRLEELLEALDDALTSPRVPEALAELYAQWFTSPAVVGHQHRVRLQASDFTPRPENPYFNANP